MGWLCYFLIDTFYFFCHIERQRNIIFAYKFSPLKIFW
jgi:hypothetical protein